MSEQETVESLQDKIYSAMTSGDAASLEKANKDVEDYFESVNKQSDTTPPAQPIASQTTEQPAKDGTQNLPESGSPQQEVETNQNNDTPTLDEESKKFLDTLHPSIRVHVEKNLSLDRNKLALELYNMQHQSRADNGRVAALNRRYQELLRRSVQLEEKLAQPQAPKPQEAAPPKTNQKSITDDPDFKLIEENDPQLAKVIREREEAVWSKFNEWEDRLKRELEPLRRSSETQTMNVELQKLAHMVPNYQEILSYTDEYGVNTWQEWISRQTPNVQNLALSDHADDLVRAMVLYGQDMTQEYGGYHQYQPPAENQQQQPTNQAAASNLSDQARSAAQERERKLSSSPVGPSNVRPPQKTEPTMEEILADPVLLEKFQADYLEKLMKGEAT